VWRRPRANREAGDGADASVPKSDPFGRLTPERQLARLEREMAGLQVRVLASPPKLVPPAQAINGQTTALTADSINIS